MILLTCSLQQFLCHTSLSSFSGICSLSAGFTDFNSILLTLQSCEMNDIRSWSVDVRVYGCHFTNVGKNHKQIITLSNDIHITTHLTLLLCWIWTWNELYIYTMALFYFPHNAMQFEVFFLNHPVYYHSM